jgi:DNA-binding GntR family transcriptional regulator
MPRDANGTSLTQTAYERLRGDLLACRLEPGARLRMGDLCRSLEVGLSAVREALSRLTAEGLVVAEPQRGFRVTPISADELRDLTAVRLEIEALCVRRAVAKGNLSWEAQLVAAFHRLSRTPERTAEDPERLSEEWVEAHGAFHLALVAACDSAWLLRLREMLYSQSERYRRLSFPLAEVKRDLNREHGAIMDAALARDADRAVALMSEHLELTMRILLDRPLAAEARGEDR